MQARFAILLRHDGEGLRTSSEASAGEMGDEECEANTDRCDESATVFLSGEHENCEHQESSQEHLDEESSRESRVFGQQCCHGEFLSAQV